MQLALYVCALGALSLLLAELIAVRFANLALILLVIGVLLASVGWIVY
jgi:hypothetical protein